MFSYGSKFGKFINFFAILDLAGFLSQQLYLRRRLVLVSVATTPRLCELTFVRSNALVSGDWIIPAYRAAPCAKYAGRRSDGPGACPSRWVGADDSQLPGAAERGSGIREPRGGADFPGRDS